MMKKFTAYVLAICAMCQSVASAQITSTQTSEEGDIRIDSTLPDKYVDDYYMWYDDSKWYAFTQDKDKNKNVLEKEIIPEIIPLPRAVKKLEANTDIPKINNDGA